MQTPSESVKKRTALLAEDDAALTDLVRHTLRRVGFSVRCIPDGVTAINEILEHKPEIILLDLVLPRLSGEEICTMVRKSPQVNHTPIIVISGRTDRQTRLQLFERGADDFIAKPFDPDELIARVQVAWQRAWYHEPAVMAVR